MSGPIRVEASSRADRVQKVRSPGGIEAWLVEDYAVPLVALEFSVRGGASQDPVGRAGAATMLAGLLDEGAGQLDSEAFHRALEDKAIELSFSADYDGFTGRLKSLTRNVDAAFEMLRLAIVEPRLDAEPIDRIRGQLAAQVRRENEDPGSLAARTWRAEGFPGHPYGRPARGSLESLPAIERGDLTDLLAGSFARDTLKVAVVGAIDAARVSRMLDEVFASLPAQGRRETVPAIVLQKLGSRHVVDLDVPQATIHFGRPGVLRKDPDYMPAFVLNHILGGGAFSSRLYQEVREKRGLAYTVYSSLATYDHSGVLFGSTSTKNERALESLGLIETMILDLLRDGPTDEEVEKAKKYLTGSYALRFDTSTKIAGQLVNLQSEGFDVSYLDERNRQVANVTKADIQRAAARLFGDGQLLVVMAGRPTGV